MLSRLRRMIFPSPSDLSPERMADLDARLTRREDIESLIRANQKIEAIKLYRQDTQASLFEAKTAVEAIEADLDKQ